jgi:hypothetical protein
LLIILTYWKKPENYILSEDTLEIIQYSSIIGGCGKVGVGFESFFAIFNSCVLFGDKPEVEEEEASDHET